MSKRPSKPLTGAELRIMDVLWNLGSGTVAEVAASLLHPPLAYNTVLSILRILERKGHVRHKDSGRAFIYRPVLQREDATQSAIGELVSRFFASNPGELALRIIERRRLSDDELARLRQLIDKYDE